MTLRPLGLACLTAGLLLAPAARAATPIPYPDAVANSRTTARMVLDKVAAESCLRGRLNRAMIKLSDSCAAQGERSELCRLADKVAATTPVSSDLMVDASRRILELTEPTSAQVPAQAITP
jgi:hydroxyethylthiazole kinase-like sugar kinase family protein